MPTSKLTLRSGRRSGLPCVICVRPPTMLVLNPVSAAASAGTNARPAVACARSPAPMTCLKPTLGLNTAKVVYEGTKRVLKGVSTVSGVLGSTSPPSESTVRPWLRFNVFSAYAPMVRFVLSAENGASRSPVGA